MWWEYLVSILVSVNLFEIPELELEIDVTTTNLVASSTRFAQCTSPLHNGMHRASDDARCVPDPFDNGSDGLTR